LKDLNEKRGVTTMKLKLFTSIIIVFLFILTHSTFAHHLWIEKENSIFKILWGHPPDVSPYEPEKLKEAKALDTNGKEVSLTRKNDKDMVYFSSKGNVSIIAVSFEGGYLVTTPDGKKRLTKKEAIKSGLQVIDSIYSSHFAKGLFAYTNGITKPVGLKFEIIPLKNPFILKTGEILPIKVYFDGAAVEGVTIEINNNKEIIKTDKQGIANVKISEKGQQFIIAKYRTPIKGNPDADYLSYTTVLTFEVK
jgi:nickel transport protein